MIGKGECWDSAHCENFWGKLKKEWLNHCGTLESIDQVRLAVFEYIEGILLQPKTSRGTRLPNSLQGRRRIFLVSVDAVLMET